MTVNDDLLARLDAESATGCSDPATCQDHWCRLAQDAAAALRTTENRLAKSNARQEFYGKDAAHWQNKCDRTEAQRDDLHAAIFGCDCPAPYIECPHDMPFVDQVAHLETDVREARGQRDAAYSCLRRRDDDWQPSDDFATWWRIDTTGLEHTEPMSTPEAEAMKSALGGR